MIKIYFNFNKYRVDKGVMIKVADTFNSFNFNSLT